MMTSKILTVGKSKRHIPRYDSPNSSSDSSDSSQPDYYLPTYYQTNRERPKRQQDYRAGCILISPAKRILCVRNVASGCWGFPKGRIHSEIMEDTKVAALRELYEETSVQLRPEDLTLPVRKSKATLFIVCVGDENAIDVRVDNYECDNYEWLTLDDLKKRNNSRLTREFFHRISLFISQIS